MTTNQIISAVNKRTNNRASKDQLDTKAELLVVIQELCQEHKWFWRRKSAVVTTVANTRTYDLADANGAALTDFDKVADKKLQVFQNGAKVSDCYPEFSPEEQDKMREGTDSNIPTSYFFAGSPTTLELYPIPNGVYRIRVPYWATPQISPEELGDDVPLVPKHLHSLLQEGLEVRVLRWLLGEDSTKYIAAKNAYDDKVIKSAEKEDFAPGNFEEWRNQDDNDAVQSTR